MTIQYLSRKDKPKLAYVHSSAHGHSKKHPQVMFLGGYRSDMNGTKANYFEQACQARGQGYVRFDYSGHGESEGAFEDGTIGAWMNDALDVFDHVIDGPAVLVGSSMGGWIALLVALARGGMVSGVVGLAAAPDFTEEIYHKRLSDAQRETLNTEGAVAVPNDYSDEPYFYTKHFYDEAKDHLLLVRDNIADFSLRLVQGMQDKDVPWETAVKIQKAFRGEESDIVFIEDGDHRLSRPEDLTLIDKEILSLSSVY